MFVAIAVWRLSVQVRYRRIWRGHTTLLMRGDPVEAIGLGLEMAWKLEGVGFGCEIDAARRMTFWGGVFGR